MRGVFLIYLCFLAACKSSKESVVTPPTVEKEVTISEVMDLANLEDKLIFVDVYTTWCLPCRLMEEEVFSDKITMDYMRENYIFHRVDAEKGEGPDINTIFQVTTYPTLLFLTANGQVILKHEGGLSIEDFTNLAKRAVREYRAGS